MSAEQQLRSMAARHHATMKKLDGLREQWAVRKDRFVSTLETGAGAFAAGLVQGRTEGFARDPVTKFTLHPLALGTTILALGYLDIDARRTDDIIHFGNGYVASYFAAKGFAFGEHRAIEAHGKVAERIRARHP